MKWLFRWMRNGINNLEREEDSPPELFVKNSTATLRVRPKGLGSPGEINLNQQAMHFKIYPATGGHIVEYTYFNDKRDRHDQALHLIPSDLDLGSELSKIMTLEALKR